jgi:hypothetical protein
MSQIFAVDIHPAAVIGWGVMLDHATGIVIGETAVVGDNVSMLHHVSLGGSGTGRGERLAKAGRSDTMGSIVKPCWMACKMGLHAHMHLVSMHLVSMHLTRCLKGLTTAAS